MEEPCPNCGKPLTTKKITNKMGQGVIEYPVANICPKCGWNRDLTGASDIIPDPGGAKTGKTLDHISQIEPTSPINQIVVLGLIVLVIGGLAYAFLSHVQEETPFYQNSTPGIFQKSIPATIETQVQEDTVIPTGKKWPVLLDYSKGFVRNNDLTIKLGDEVVWDNINTVPVTLVSEDGLFEKILLDYGKHTSFMMTKPGKYVFYLEKNRNMTGTITVIKP